MAAGRVEEIADLTPLCTAAERATTRSPIVVGAEVEVDVVEVVVVEPLLLAPAPGAEPEGLEPPARGVTRESVGGDEDEDEDILR